MLRMIRALAGAVLAAAAFMSAPASAAPTLGDTVTCFSFDFICSSDSATVAPIREFTLSGLLGADFDTNVLTLSNISGTQLQFMNNTVLFSDTTSRFTAATVQSSSGVSNFGTATLNSNGALRIQFSNTTTTFSPGGSITFALAPAAAVPEPGIWAMMILGTGAIGFAMRSAKRRSDEKFDAKIKRITQGAMA